MGIFRDTFGKGIEFFREEVLPLRSDLIKAGVLTPDKSAYEQKANLTDPTNYGSMNFGYKEKFALIDYQKCRQISYANPIIAAIMQVRINQIASFSLPQEDKYKIGFKIKLRDGKKKPNKAEENKIKELQQFIQYTGVPENFEDTPERRKRDNFESFLRKVARDSLTFDQINFEVVPRNNGMPYSFHAVDGATIRMIPDEKEKSEYFGGKSSFDAKALNSVVRPHENEFNEFKPKNPKFVQLIGGTISKIFDEWEMAFGVRNPRTDVLSHGYGFSEIEMLVATITSHMNAESYNRRFFTQGSTIKGILTFEGAVPADQLESFRRQWYMQATGITNSWKTPIMSLGEGTKLNWTSLHASNSEMEFGKWMEYCIKSICGVFQIDPVEIGFDISKQSSGQSGGGGGLHGDDHANRVLYSQEKGLRPILRHIQTLINEYIIFRIDPNFEFEFVGLNAKSETEELEEAIKQVKHFKTVNEIRAEHDLEPIKGFEDIKSAGDLLLDNSWIQAWGQGQQQDMMGDMGGMGEEGDMGGEEGDMGQGQEEQQEEEPDYENMSIEELEEELSKIQSMNKSFRKEIKL